MNTLLVLAYNEEENISEVILSLKDEFDDIIVVNDSSQDSTESLLKKLSLNSSKIKILTNFKNLDAGKSFEVGIKAFLESSSSYLVKIDGDGQFNKKDVLNIKKLLNESNFDFIKCDRFWDGGIEGDIPNIRYYGNAFASFLIKFSTGNWSINDPLNGLFLFSKNAAKKIEIPKLFYRYGYPFYLCTLFSNYSIFSDLKFMQIKNKVSYGDENSSLKAFTLFIKILRHTVSNYFRNIGKKVKVSSFHVSALLDLLSTLLMPLLFYCSYKIISFRYFDSTGSQYNWFTFLILLLILFLISVISSQKIVNKMSKENFISYKFI